MATLETEVVEEWLVLEDENPVTFQIVLKGSDGIVAGSDRLTLVKGQRASRFYDQYQAVEGSKFFRKEDDSVICFAAGGPQAAEIPKAIVPECKPDLAPLSWQKSLVKVAEFVPGNSKLDEIIVIRRHPGDVVLVNRNLKVASCQEIQGALCTGLPAYCRFLTQCFWKPASVGQLKGLALLALHYAAGEYPGGVGKGFDVMLLIDGNVSWERYAEDDPRIRRMAKRFDSQVLRALFSDKPQTNLR